jgi:hypothetical protein
MSLLLDIFNGIVYLIVSLIILFVLGIIYMGFVFYVFVKELVIYLYRKLT